MGAKTGNTFPQYMALLLPKTECSEKPLCMSLMKNKPCRRKNFIYPQAD